MIAAAIIGWKMQKMMTVFRDSFGLQPTFNFLI